MPLRAANFALDFFRGKLYKFKHNEQLNFRHKSGCLAARFLFLSAKFYQQKENFMKSADRVWTRGFVLVILINFLFRCITCKKTLDHKL